MGKYYIHTDMKWNGFWWINKYFTMNFILKMDGDELISD
jgi:hypothetical protein